MRQFPSSWQCITDTHRWNPTVTKTSGSSISKSSWIQVFPSTVFSLQPTLPHRPASWAPAPQLWRTGRMESWSHSTQWDIPLPSFYRSSINPLLWDFGGWKEAGAAAQGQWDPTCWAAAPQGIPTEEPAAHSGFSFEYFIISKTCWKCDFLCHETYWTFSQNSKELPLVFQ